MDSLPPVIRKHWPLAATALLFALYGWALVAATGSGHDGLIGPHFNALGADWVIFMAAGRAVFSGDLAHIYHQAWITQAVNTHYAGWLSGPEPFPLFPYPPVFLLLVTPFALLPIGWSLALSQLLQFAGLAWAIRQFAPNRAWLFLAAGAALAPAASNNVLAGSNAMLVAALIVGGVANLEKKSLLAGALLGLVIFKPQFVPLLVVALVAGGYWRALGAATVTALLFVGASMIVFSPYLWLEWINVYLLPQTVGGLNATDWGHMWDDSVSTCVTLLGAPHWLAITAQGLAIAFSLVVVWRVFRASHPAQLPVLLCAGLLASPHVSNYDLIGLAIAALMLVRWLAPNTRPIFLLLPLMAYAAPLYNPPRALWLGLVTPLILLAMIQVLGRATVKQRGAQV